MVTNDINAFYIQGYNNLEKSFYWLYLPSVLIIDLLAEKTKKDKRQDLPRSSPLFFMMKSGRNQVLIIFFSLKNGENKNRTRPTFSFFSCRNDEKKNRKILDLISTK